MKELYNDFITVFDLQSDRDCRLIRLVYATLLDYHGLYSNGRAEDIDEMELNDKLVELFNTDFPPEMKVFNQLLSDYVYSQYPPF